VDLIHRDVRIVVSLGEFMPVAESYLDSRLVLPDCVQALAQPGQEAANLVTTCLDLLRLRRGLQDLCQRDRCLIEDFSQLVQARITRCPRGPSLGAFISEKRNRETAQADDPADDHADSRSVHPYLVTCMPPQMPHAPRPCRFARRAYRL
jgi:hypothetical protein